MAGHHDTPRRSGTAIRDHGRVRWPVPLAIAVLVGVVLVVAIVGLRARGDGDDATASGSTTSSTTTPPSTTEPASSSTTVAVPVAEPAATYEVVGLGTLGGDVAWASDVNAAGQIVGTSTTGATGTGAARYQAFVWDPGSGRMQGLGALGPPGTDSTAAAINDAGIVVGASGPLNCVEPGCRATRWDPATGQMDDLGTLADDDPPELDVNSAALDINSAGQIVGHSTTTSGEHHAFLWDPDTGSMTDLGTLGGTYSVAEAINDRGEVTGSSSTASGMIRAFLWSPETGEMQDLGPDESPEESLAGHGINDTPTVVGWSEGGLAGFIWWSDDRGVEDLGEVQPNDINAAGLVVGARYIRAPADAILPVAMSAEAGIVVELPGLDGSTWGSAHGVNDAGVIVGSVTTDNRPDSLRAVRWSPVPG